MRIFIAPVLVSLAVLAGIGLWGGGEMLLLAAALAALEISLSFDNAVLNAKVLGRMSALWQRRFLTWGMLVAVFGVRFVLPVLIVAAAALASPVRVVMLALKDPAAYAALLAHSEGAIHAFGGVFLLMVALRFFFDEEKEVHWIRRIERRLARLGRFSWLETAIALCAVAVLALVAQGIVIFAAGMVAVLLYLAIERFVKTLGSMETAAAGLSLFVYLNVLDAAFSLDGVVGAFALTTQIPVILAGLGIGAYFVRSFTVHLTRRRTIETFRYLEHGAHWAIFSLALCLFAALFMRVPEAVPGAIGLVFAALSYLSSRRELR
jgi:hypothetical protein